MNSEVRKTLSQCAPSHAAVLLLAHAGRLVESANEILCSAANHQLAETADAERYLGLRARGETIAAEIHHLESSLLNPEIDQRVNEILERHPEYNEYPSFRPSVRVLVEYLTSMVGDGWPLAVLCSDGADVDERGVPVVHSWAFAVLPFDTTSYIRPPTPGDERGDGITWMGTTWEPGCECDDLGSDDEHLAGCPASR